MPSRLVRLLIPLWFLSALLGAAILLPLATPSLSASSIQEPVLVLVGSASYPDRPMFDVGWYANHVFIPQGRYGMVILDVSDPTAPVEVSWRTTSTNDLRRIVIADNGLAYVLYVRDRIDMLDVSDPRNVVFLHRDSATGSYGQVDLYDDYLYEASRDLYIFRYNTATGGYGQNGRYTLTSGYAEYVRTEGSKALMVYTPRSAEIPAGVEIANIDTPANLSFVGRWLVPEEARERFGEAKIAASGNYMFVTVPGIVTPDGTDLFPGWIYTVDISDPANPTTVGVYRGYKNPQEPLIHNGALFVIKASPEQGVGVFSISDPGNLQEIGYVDTGGANALAAGGQHVFVVGGNHSLSVLRYNAPFVFVPSHYLYLPAAVGQQP